MGVFGCRWIQAIELLLELSTAFTKGSMLVNDAESCFEIAACIATGEGITLAEQRCQVAAELAAAAFSGFQHQKPEARVHPQGGQLTPRRTQLSIGLQESQGLEV